MGDKTRGLYGKFKVERTDGRSAPGGKHDGCQYFVLDTSCDPHAIPALLAYAQSCKADYPLLARDVRLMAQRNCEQSIEQELVPAEKIALMVGLAQVRRGDEPMPNISSVCILALARLTGRFVPSDSASREHEPQGDKHGEG